MNFKQILLCIIISLAFFLRIWNITTNPPGVHADEADSGYNAYSILKTGKDFYGNFLPVQIVGFGENYRAPLSTYLTIPSVAVFGLNTFAIRLPAVVLGTLFVLLIYLITKKIFDSEFVGIIAAILAAVNPWAVHISRSYADHILALDLVLLGLLFLLLKNKTFLASLFAGFSLGLSMFSYHAPKIFLPIFLPIFYFFYRKELFSKKTIISVIVFCIFLASVFSLSFFSKGASEFGIVSIFNTTNANKSVNDERRLTKAPLKIASFFHNKMFYYVKAFTRNALQSVSFDYLYLDSESNLTAATGNRGLFYPIELPFLFIGFYFLIRKKRNLALLLGAWILFSIVPGSLTTNQMYTYRNIFLLPAIISVTAFGMFEIYEKIKKTQSFSLIRILFIILFGMSVVAYYFHYFYDYPVYAASWWAVPQKEALQYVLQNKDKYTKIFIDGGRDWVLLYAFYSKTNPIIFQHSIQNSYKEKNGYTIIDKVEFGDFKINKKDSPGMRFPVNSLVIVDGSNFPDSKPIKEILAKSDWGTIYKIIEVK